MEVEIKRGDVVWVDFPASNNPVDHIQLGIRPAIVIQNDAANECSQTTIVVPLTSVIKRLDLPMHVPFTVDILPRRSMALCEQLITVNRERVLSNVGHLPKFVMQQIDLGIIRSVLS